MSVVTLVIESGKVVYVKAGDCRELLHDAYIESTLSRSSPLTTETWVRSGGYLYNSTATAYIFEIPEHPLKINEEEDTLNERERELTQREKNYELQKNILTQKEQENSVETLRLQEMEERLMKLCTRFETIFSRSQLLTNF